MYVYVYIHMCALRKTQKQNKLSIGLNQIGGSLQMHKEPHFSAQKFNKSMLLAIGGVLTKKGGNTLQLLLMAVK